MRPTIRPTIRPTMRPTSRSKTSLTTPIRKTQKDICIFGNGYYPDTDSGCRYYYVCFNQGTSNPKAYRYACPRGKIFDIKSKGCYASNMVVCTSRKDQREFTDSTSTSITSTTTTSLAISSLCTNGNGYYVRKGTNCREYYYCAFVNTDFERIYNYSCKDNYKFNPDIRRCDMVECFSD
ncbi:hypothetical protein BpHYR1_036669 [Brachionus plicatilis]|uniref:Chitin-binding type-2 domain-containing protein n=1 Tax=Brachionus plicatilis TaxID=10195 RepID=A0A3M7P3T0_BRAPC|nr:hypothetical protein BpHYR1_036669 [Brachionus plicatilis]